MSLNVLVPVCSNNLNNSVSETEFWLTRLEVKVSRCCCCFVMVWFFRQALFCFEQFDELTLLHLREFDRKKLISVETDIVVDHYKEDKFQDSKAGKISEQ